MSLLSKKRKDFEHLTLNSYQKNYLSEIKKIEPAQPFAPWKKVSIIGSEGLLAIGWTANNEVVVVSHDKYKLFHPDDGDILLEVKDSTHKLISSNNLTFTIPETKQIINIFGIYGGNGNLVTSDGWKLEIAYPAWPNSIVILRKPSGGTNTNKIWENIRLINLELLEYRSLNCGFSPNENYFLISGPIGVEIFYREGNEK